MWVVRVVARKAMGAAPQRFGSPGEAMAEMEKRKKDHDACLPVSDARRIGSWHWHTKLPNK